MTHRMAHRFVVLSFALFSLALATSVAVESADCLPGEDSTCTGSGDTTIFLQTSSTKRLNSQANSSGTHEGEKKSAESQHEENMLAALLQAEQDLAGNVAERDEEEVFGDTLQAEVVLARKVLQSARRLQTAIGDNHAQQAQGQTQETAAQLPAASSGAMSHQNEANPLAQGRVLYAVNARGQIDRANSDLSCTNTFVDQFTGCDLAGRGANEGARSYSGRPVGIAVDKERELMFFTDWMGGTRMRAVDPEDDKDADGNPLCGPAARSAYLWSFSASIAKVSLRGDTGVEMIITSGEVLQNKACPPILWEPSQPQSWPYGIALDTKNQKIYWTDKDPDAPAIKRANYDGTGVEKLPISFQKGSAPRAIAIDVDREVMYFSDDNIPDYCIGIRKSNLDGTATEKLACLPSHVNDIEVSPDGTQLVVAVISSSTINPGGIMRVGTSLDGSRRRGRHGQSNRGAAYSVSDDATHLVVCPQVPVLHDNSRIGSARRRRVAPGYPQGVAVDWDTQELWFTTREAVAQECGVGGLECGEGGSVYRVSMTGTLPDVGFAKDWFESYSASQPNGPLMCLGPDNKVEEMLVKNEKGSYMSEPYLRDIELVPNAADDASSSCAGDPELQPAAVTPFGGMPDKSGLGNPQDMMHYVVHLSLVGHDGHWGFHMTGKHFTAAEPKLLPALTLVYGQNAGGITVRRAPADSIEDGKTIVHLCLGISSAIDSHTVEVMLPTLRLAIIDPDRPNYDYSQMISSTVENVNACDQSWRAIA